MRILEAIWRFLRNPNPGRYLVRHEIHPACEVWQDELPAEGNPYETLIGERPVKLTARK